MTGSLGYGMTVSLGIQAAAHFLAAGCAEVDGENSNNRTSNFYGWCGSLKD